MTSGLRPVIASRHLRRLSAVIALLAFGGAIATCAVRLDHRWSTLTPQGTAVQRGMAIGHGQLLVSRDEWTPPSTGQWPARNPLQVMPHIAFGLRPTFIEYQRTAAAGRPTDVFTQVNIGVAIPLFIVGCVLTGLALPPSGIRDGCRKCGYPVGQSARCPECGSERPA